jgi:hypothetical protein
MRRHAPEYVKLKRDKRTRELVAVFLLVPTLTNADWREPHIPATSKTCTRLDTLDRDTVYECLECGCNHGGLQRGPHRCFAFKGKVITEQWMEVLRHETGPLYRTKGIGI